MNLEKAKKERKRKLRHVEAMPSSHEPIFFLLQFFRNVLMCYHFLFYMCESMLSVIFANREQKEQKVEVGQHSTSQRVDR